jgi:hypothetical protein
MKTVLPLSYLTRTALLRGDEEDATPPAKHLKLEKDTAVFLKGATEKPLEHEKQTKLIARFPLPATDAAHPPKLDKDISALIPKSAFTYDRLLSKIQQFNMGALGPLLHDARERSCGMLC